MQTFHRYGILIVFSVLFIVGLFIRYFLGDQSKLWDIWNTIDVSFAVVLGILAFFAYRDIVRAEDQVRLIFNIEKAKQIDTGLCLLRKNCTRSEVIGLITMMKNTNKPLKYDIHHLHALLEEINSVQTSRAGKLFIPLYHDEFHQFDLKTS
jgi:hypothetical protein